MYLMYVDESGDIGLAGSPTTHFALTGLVIHESEWRTAINRLIAFRKILKSAHGLPVRTEIHASEYLRSPPIPGMAKHVRLAVLRNFLDELGKMPFISVTNVVVQKQGKPPNYDIFSNAWQALFQRFENTLSFGNFPGAHRNDFGLVLTDNTDGRKLTRMVRKMAVFNPVPYGGGRGTRNLPLVRIIEDPHLRDSRDSHFIQASDTCAYFLMQKFCPNSYVRRVGAQNYLNRLAPILNRHASRTDPNGIVVL